MATTAEDSVALLVIGSGPAGVHAAAAYVAHGGEGPVGLASADIDEPYLRPPLSKDVLAGEQAPEVTPILEDEDGSLARVEVRLGTRVSAVDLVGRRVTTDDGTELRYEQLVVATGSDPLPLPGVDREAHVLTLRSLQDARRLTGVVSEARSAVVVGSGFIGCEAAASLAARGLRVDMVTPEAVPQAERLGTWAGSRIAVWLEADGVRLQTGVQVTGVDASGTAHLEDGTTLEADLVLAAIGVTQSRPFLEESGLAVDGGRLVADHTLRTSDPHVWAAGDVALASHGVAGRPLGVEHWGDAVSMGELAGTNAAAVAADQPAETGSWTSPPGFWSEIGGRTLKYSAWGDGHADAHVVEHEDGAFTVWYADADGELVGVLTHGCDDDYERGGELLARRASLQEALSTHTGRAS